MDERPTRLRSSPPSSQGWLAVILFPVVFVALGVAIAGMFLPLAPSGGPSDVPCTTPIDDSCLPRSIDSWTVTDVLHSEKTVLNGATDCSSQPVSEGCIPKNLTLDYLTVTNLTVKNSQEIEVVTQTEFPEIVLTGPMTCPSGSVDGGCLDLTGVELSGGVCQTALPGACIPAPPPIDLTGVELSGGVCQTALPGTCIPAPPPIDLTGVELSGGVCQTALPGTCIPPSPPVNLTGVDLSEGICEAPLVDACIPPAPPLNLTDVDLAGSVCGAALPTDCIPDIPLNLTGSVCEEPLSSSCIPEQTVNVTGVDISGGTCSVPLTVDCIPNQAVNLTGVDLSGGVCEATLPANCIPAEAVDLTGVDLTPGNCSEPLSPACFPALDAQSVTGQTADSTTSTSYVDMFGMTLTASNTGLGTYIIHANTILTRIGVDAGMAIVININGVDITDSITDVFGFNGVLTQVSTVIMQPVVNGQVIKIRYKMSPDGGQLNVARRQLVIHQIS